MREMYSSVVLSAVAKAVRRINGGLSAGNGAEALSGLNDFLLVAEQGYGEVKLTPVFFSLLSHVLAAFSLLLEDQVALSTCNFSVDRWFGMLARSKSIEGGMTTGQIALALYEAIVPPIARSTPAATPRLVESLMASATVHTRVFAKAVFRACLDGLVELVGISPVVDVNTNTNTDTDADIAGEAPMSPAPDTKGPKRDYPVTLSKLLFAIESRIGECENQDEAVLVTNIVESLVPLAVYACSKAELSVASELEAQLIRLRSIVCAFVGHGADEPQEAQDEIILANGKRRKKPGRRKHSSEDGEEEEDKDNDAEAEAGRLASELAGGGIPARCAGVLSMGCGVCSLCLLGRPAGH